MAIISEDIRAFLTGRLAWVATADNNGAPNMAPKGTVDVLDGDTLIFADLFSLKTRENLEKNNQVAVAVVDAATPTGYQFKGRAELLSAGSLFDSVAKKLKDAMPDLPTPKYVVKIKVEAIYSLSPGPDAGKKIA
ncbi:MAG: pyridoxamine 5'-phosphate oxidase family protein [Deltaproteobacteria bacterium]|jgi:predicted pyridoxine 5'-phosphate oxidase superfamily flavin-nucleotide-binding protein|nr:pyridoxamine 5'-phosphate oxidase family protein [Deltaproteobacteria bacterium]